MPSTPPRLHPPPHNASSRSPSLNNFGAAAGSSNSTQPTSRFTLQSLTSPFKRSSKKDGDSDSEHQNRNQSSNLRTSVSTSKIVLTKTTTKPMTMVDPIFDYQFRVILIGDSTVGKSSLLRSFTDGTFAEVSDPTVGVDFFARLVRVRDGSAIKLQLWDTAGQERFRSITKAYYRNSVAAVLVYDVCNRESFKHIPTWMAEARKHIEPYQAVFVLVGCKTDLVDENAREEAERENRTPDGEPPPRREVGVEEAESFAEYHNIPFVETSAKKGVNVDAAFELLTQEVYDRIKNGEFKLDDGWDGIKRGYFGRVENQFFENNNQGNSASGSSNITLRPNSRSSSSLRSRSPPPLLIAQPLRRKCC